MLKKKKEKRYACNGCGFETVVVLEGPCPGCGHDTKPVYSEVTEEAEEEAGP
jgi:ribosomal protein L37E